MPDIADVAWSEHDERNSEAVPNGWPTGAFPAYTDLVGQMMMGATKRFWNKINPVYQTSGTGDDYVVQTEIGIDQINLYEILCIRIDRSNTTTTPTLQFGATNARTIVKAGPSGYVPLAAGDMYAGNSHTFWYNGAFYILVDPAISNLQPLSPNLTSWAAITRAAGFDAWVATPSSANLRALVSDETGTGALYFQNGDIGTPTAGVATNLTGLPISTGVSGLAANMAAFLAAGTSASLRAAITDESGTGALLFQNGALGTPASGTATNLTGLPLTTGVTGTLPIGNGGTGQTTASAAFDALSPNTTRGDITYRNATTNARLAASTAGYHLQTNGTGADPSWAGFQQSGTGAVTRTWQSKAQETVTPEDFGAVGDGTTDDSTAIQNAINTGKIVRFKAQTTYAIGTGLTVGNGNSTTLSTQNGIVLQGTTSGASAAEMSPAVLPTRLKWIGSSGAAMLTVNGPMVGCNIKGIVFDCNSLANNAVKTNHMIASTWQDVLATNYKGFAFIHEAYAAFSGLAQGANKNTFINCRAMSPASGGQGMRVGVTSGFTAGMLDVAQNVWINCEWYRDGTSAGATSLYLAFCDNCTFIECQFSAAGGTSGVCVYVLPPTGGAGNTAFPDEILFLNCPLMTGITADLSWAPNNGILCDPYPTNDSEPIPTSPYVRGRTFRQQFFNGGTFTAKFGYDTGAGGTVTQATSKSTGVTLSKLSGQITMNAAALAAGAIVSFTLTNTAIAATDVLILNHVSGGTAGAYSLNAQCASGSASINVRNNTAGSLSEAIVIAFALIKAVTA